MVQLLWVRPGQAKIVVPLVTGPLFNWSDQHWTDQNWSIVLQTETIHKQSQAKCEMLYALFGHRSCIYTSLHLSPVTQSGRLSWSADELQLQQYLEFELCCLGALVQLWKIGSSAVSFWAKVFMCVCFRLTEAASLFLCTNMFTYWLWPGHWDEEFLVLRGASWTFFSIQTQVAYIWILASSHAPCRDEAKQDCERLRTPPTPLRQNSLVRSANSAGRHADDEGSLRRRAVKVGKGKS